MLGSAPGGMRATFWLAAARATCTRTLYDPFDWPFGAAPRTKGDLQQLKALYLESATAEAESAKVAYSHAEFNSACE